MLVAFVPDYVVPPEEPDLNERNYRHDCEAAHQALYHAEIVLEADAEARKWDVLDLHALDLLFLILSMIVKQLVFVAFVAQFLDEIVAEAKADSRTHHILLMLHQLFLKAPPKWLCDHWEHVEEALLPQWPRTPTYFNCSFNLLRRH